ncbi:MAG: hypothetical protein WC331_11305 [Candidatus Omnitrophota bacterium]|jgi:hypothetical protein
MEEKIKELMSVMQGIQKTEAMLIDCLKIVGNRITQIEREVDDLKVLVNAGNIVGGK